MSGFGEVKEINCPNKGCLGRFVMETDGSYARGICKSCGGEIVYRSKERRGEDLTLARTATKVPAKPLA